MFIGFPLADTIIFELFTVLLSDRSHTVSFPNVPSNLLISRGFKRSAASSTECLGVGEGACWLSPCRRHTEVSIAHIHMHLTSWQEPLIIKCSASSGLNEAHSDLCPWILGIVANRKGPHLYRIYLSTLQLCALVNCPFSTSSSYDRDPEPLL